MATQLEDSSDVHPSDFAMIDQRFPSKSLIHRSSTPTFSESSDEEDGGFRSKLGLLRDRTNGLVAATESTDWQSSPATHACRVSVRSRMKDVLRQAEGFVSSFEACNDLSKLTIHRLRCSVVLLRAEQYLDMIESAMENPPRDELDRRLLEIIESEKLQSVREAMGGEFCFRISPWVSSFLAFDLPAGQVVQTSVDDLPLSVQVEPMLEFNSLDLLEKRDVLSQVKACEVSIEKCKHVSRSFSAGAGTIGECMLQVRLTPKGDIGENKSSQIWGQDFDVPTLSIREARAVQRNAYPPKPKGNVDIYTSYHYGDSSVTVNLVMKTFTTSNDETPDLQVELFLSLSS